MSKPDREALQQEYTADYHRSGISLEKWCEERGHNYNTLRRYIKKPSKNAQEKLRKTAQKSAQVENAQTAQKLVKKTSLKSAKKTPERITHPQTDMGGHDEDDIFSPDYFGISEQQGVFAEHVAAGKPLIEAYRLAGYKSDGNAAYVTASQLLRNPKVARAIRWLRDKRQRRLALVESEIIHQLVSIASADPNALSQIRRVNCRYCWGEDHRYQWNDMGEYEKAEEKASEDDKEPPEFGGVGFVDSAIPNTDCPKCFGEGLMRTFFADTTQLDGPDRWLFAGVKETMNGLEIKTANQDAARRELLRLAQANRGRLPAGGSGDNPGKEELELARLRLGNEKLQAEIDNIKKGKQESNLVVVHNALQIPGAVQLTQEELGEGED